MEKPKELSELAKKLGSELEVAVSDTLYELVSSVTNVTNVFSSLETKDDFVEWKKAEDSLDEILYRVSQIKENVLVLRQHICTDGIDPADLED